MRYYELTITDPDGSNWILQSNGLGLSKGTGPIASSLFTTATAGGSAQLVGQNNPGALNLEFDLPVSRLHEPQGAAWIRIWGVGIKALSQAANLNRADGKFKSFVLKAGMSKGLPLANPNQAGIVAQGQILQAFGNWSGTNQTIDLSVQPGPLPPAGGAGVQFNWKEGQGIDDAITQTIAQAMPGYKASVNISQNLFAPNAQPGWYPHFDSWADAVRDYTSALGQQIFGKSYEGVQIAVADKTVNVFDGQGPTPPQPIILAFQDLVGQPTWISGTEIAFPLVLRADIDVLDQIKFPTGIMPPYALTTPDSAFPNTPAASSVIFQGAFAVNEIHHYGNFRQEDAAAWNSTFKAVALGATSSS